MREITNGIETYYELFSTFEPFNNFLKYAIKYESPQVFVDDQFDDCVVVLYSFPAYFILGNPNTNIHDLFKMMKPNSWIIPHSEAWNQPIEEYFAGHVDKHERVLFDSSALDINHILQYRQDLPKGLEIVPIEEKHVHNGMIYDDVTTRFFSKTAFLESGFGFALVDRSGFCEGFALTNYPIVDHNVELYFRVGYDSYPEYRSKGFGTTLCTYFIEEALKRGYNPVWDSANDASSHIAKKLGYLVERVWKMYHVL